MTGAFWLICDVDSNVIKREITTLNCRSLKEENDTKRIPRLCVDGGVAWPPPAIFTLIAIPLFILLQAAACPGGGRTCKRMKPKPNVVRAFRAYAPCVPHG